MVKSVEFPNDGEGYLYPKYEEPELGAKKPVMPKKDSKSYNLKGELLESVYKRDMERYERDMKRYKKAYESYKRDMAEYKRHKGEFICNAAYNLVGKSFKFESGKVNVIFGPNASGKTTILKAIAGEAMTEDGFTALGEPIEVRSSIFNGSVTDDTIRKHIGTIKKNDSSVDWDGSFVYYHNFQHTLEQGVGYIGTLMGSDSPIFKTFEDEINYRLGRNRSSAGEKNMWILSKLIDVLKTKVTLKDIVEVQFNKINGDVNDIWADAYQKQIEYFSRYPMYGEYGEPTILFDELDSSIDVYNTWKMFNGMFPDMVKELGVQVICVTHNPLVLTETIRNNPMYNFIHIDQKYSDMVMDELKNVKF